MCSSLCFQEYGDHVGVFCSVVGERKSSALLVLQSGLRYDYLPKQERVTETTTTITTTTWAMATTTTTTTTSQNIL